MKLWTSNFACNIHMVDRNESPFLDFRSDNEIVHGNFLGKVTVGVVRETRNYRLHRAVIFAIAQLSCFVVAVVCAEYIIVVSQCSCCLNQRRGAAI